MNVTGTFMILALPLITGLVYGHETLRSSAMIGGITQSIGQVIAAAQLVGGEVVQTATIFKIIRIVFIVLVALAFSRMSVEKRRPPCLSGRGAAAGKVKAGVPWFIVGFFILAAANTLHPGARPVGGGGQGSEPAVRDHCTGRHWHAGKVPGPGGRGPRPCCMAFGGRLPDPVCAGAHRPVLVNLEKPPVRPNRRAFGLQKGAGWVIMFSNAKSAAKGR